MERAIIAAGHVPVDMADFPAADQAPADLCAERVRGCDVYLGILGVRYGFPVRDEPDVSYTELEFDTVSTRAASRGRWRRSRPSWTATRPWPHATCWIVPASCPETRSSRS